MEKKGRLLLVLFFLLLALPPAAYSLSLTSRPIGTIVYQPGLQYSHQFVVGDTNLDIHAEVDAGPLSPYITVSDVNINEFQLLFNFPPEVKVPTGIYDLAVTVKEQPGAEAGIATLVAVSKKFTVVVYSYEKEVELSFALLNINQGSNATADLHIYSRSYQDIGSVYGEIIVRNSTAVVGKAVTEAKPLPPLDVLTFKPRIVTQHLSAGEYSAEARVFYDGKEKKVNTTFLIGTMDVLVKNYTTTIFPGFTDFTVRVMNNWGNPLRNVYAILTLNGTELVQTPSISLEPWEEGTLAAIMKVDFPPGEYLASLDLFFEGAQKRLVIPLTIIPLPPPVRQEQPAPPAQQQPLISWIIWSSIMGVIAFIILLAILLLTHRRRNHDHEL